MGHIIQWPVCTDQAQVNQGWVLHVAVNLIDNDLRSGASPYYLIRPLRTVAENGRPRGTRKYRISRIKPRAL
jgi:hypothetical protein